MTEIKQISKDQYLVREGDVPKSLFIIKSGSFAVTQFKASTEHRYADILVGEIFGETGLFSAATPYDVNLKALQNSEVIVMPYETLFKQLESIPSWTQAIFKTLVNHLQKSFHYVRVNSNEAVAVAPSNLLLNKYLSILNLTSLSHGGVFSYQQLRNTTIQIFQEPTTRMSTLANTLVELGYLAKEDPQDEDSKFRTLKSEPLTRMVDWYNEWLFKPERNRAPLLKEEEIQALQAMILFSKDLPVSHKGFTKVHLHSLQSESEAVTGRAVRKEEIISLIAKRYFAEPVMEESGVYIEIHREELSQLAENGFLVNKLSKIFS